MWEILNRAKIDECNDTYELDGINKSHGMPEPAGYYCENCVIDMLKDVSISNVSISKEKTIDKCDKCKNESELRYIFYEIGFDGDKSKYGHM